MKVDIDTGQLVDLGRAWAQAPEMVREELDTAMTEATRFLRSEVEDRTPRDTGLLAGNILGTEPVIYETPVGVIGVIGASLSYAVPVELGSKPHVIEPKNGKALAFGGGVYRRVNHPGTPAFGMFHRALNEGRDGVVRIFDAARTRIVNRLAGD